MQTQTVSTRVPADVYTAMKQQATREGTTVSRLLQTMMLQAWEGRAKYRRLDVPVYVLDQGGD